ncbi:DUF4245 domain-containing protein [Kocuria sp. p3-SID1433]|uniref:DUF4245 domain-containing protein n=1 Tax=unclassified Kocuria TaxID=2649579 RepID=UPI0021A2E7EA|nr:MULTISPECIES: DUF4245 domain-containing protein [unclassified Kocuria]MCT1601233.1 DUF4245 domain-containing protein [Kocuria sp. p3-SID1428]MCT2181037.1 DUF4245 domain-containing protein [Kocuria sp. p3-SID1433]
MTQNDDSSRTGSRAAPAPTDPAPRRAPEGRPVQTAGPEPEAQEAQPQQAGQDRGSGADQEPPVVPQLTQKQAKRVNAPARAMVLSMAVLIAIVLVFYFLQPRPDAQTYRPDVDVQREAGYAADVADFDPLVPDLGEGWSPNYARWEGQQSDGVDSWDAGWVTPRGGFIGLIQTDQANPTWTLEQIDSLPQADTVEAGGIEWEVHFGEDEDDEQRTAWIGEVEGTTVILQGTASDSEFDHAAQAVADAADDSA